jgi:protein-arginine kinase activator protein McsA
MRSLPKFSESFSNCSQQERDKYDKLFNIGEEISKLERKINKLYEKLGNGVYHQKLETVAITKEEIKLIEQEILKKTMEMEKFSD